MKTPELLRKYAQGGDVIDSEISFGIDRMKYLPASDSGTCLRWLWYERNGAEEGPVGRGFARRGQGMETAIIARLKAANVPLERAGDNQRSLADTGGRRISATPDGYIPAIGYLNTGLEIKTLDPRTNKSKLPRPKNVRQLQIAMELLSQDGIDCKDGILIYVDASNWDDVTPFRVARDPEVLDKLAPRAAKLLNARTDKNIEREGVLNDQCQHCPFTKPCGVKQTGATLKGSGDGAIRAGSKLAVLAGEYSKMKASEDLAKKAKEASGEAIKKELKAKGKAVMKAGKFLLELVAVAGRKSIDKEAMRKDGIAILKYEKTGKPSERLTVTPIDTK